MLATLSPHDNTNIIYTIYQCNTTKVKYATNQESITPSQGYMVVALYWLLETQTSFSYSTTGQDWNDGVTNSNHAQILIAKSLYLIKHNINHLNVGQSVVENQASSTSNQFCSSQFLIASNNKHDMISDYVNGVNHMFEDITKEEQYIVSYTCIQKSWYWFRRTNLWRWKQNCDYSTQLVNWANYQQICPGDARIATEWKSDYEPSAHWLQVNNYQNANQCVTESFEF